ncbi:transglutaminase domain-containing protein [Floccifex sp.]|uniref:transglutaminase domain-containing protein n=1 Tax=Floccifex sp. TaxID=2815810 RepID=UPI003F085071
MKKLFQKLILFFFVLSLSGCSLLSNFQSLFSFHKQNEVIEQVLQEYSIPDFENRYFLSQLKDEDLAFVLLAYNGLMNFKENIEIGLEFEDQNRPLELLELIQYDCPEIYQFTTNGSSNVVYNWIQSTKELVSMDITYIMDENLYQNSLIQIQNEIDNIVYQVNDLDDFHKELFVYDYIVNHCNYNEQTTHYSSIYGVFIENQAACLGISRTMQWILNECGISCITVGGYAKTQQNGHAWNIVHLEDEYYSVDCTSDTNRKEDEAYKLYAYFNVTDDLIRSSYSLQSSLFNVPETRGTKYNYFTYLNHFIYKEDDLQQSLNTILSDSYFNHHSECVIQFEDLEDFNQVVNDVSTFYNQWLNENDLPFIQASFAHSQEAKIIYFQFQ